MNTASHIKNDSKDFFELRQRYFIETYSDALRHKNIQPLEF
jgi:hypothetical protein